MKKTVLIIVLVVAVIAFAVWWKYIKPSGGTKSDTKKDSTPIKATDPPKVPGDSAGGLFSPDTGAGGVAVQKRMNEILQNKDAYAAAIAPVNAQDELFSGVEYIRPVLESNIAQSTGGSGIELMPLILSPSKTASVKALTDLRYLGPGYWEDLERVVNSAVSIKSNIGVRIFESTDYNPKDLNMPRQNLLMLIRPDGIRKGKYDTGRMGDAIQKLIKDLNQFGKNWIGLNDKAKDAVKNAAVSDLRATGWKFIGFDSPN